MGMKRISLAIITASLLFIPLAAFAQTTFPAGGSVPVTLPAGGGGAVSGGSQSIQNPLGGINSVCGLIKAVLGAVIQIGIPIAVLFIVFAGFKFVLARGNPEKLKEARNNLMYTLIGIGIFLGAWLIAVVIANTVNSLGAGSGSAQIISCN
jgi:hypothetical protein